MGEAGIPVPDRDSLAAASEDGLPLADSFGRPVTYVRISVTDRCNLRCVYCMPEVGSRFLPSDRVMTAVEIGRLGAILHRLGVRKIRLTGGEPTVRHDLVEIVRRLAELDLTGGLALSTNGVLFADLAEPLRRAGLDRVNFSLDALSDDGFKRMSRRDGANEVVRAIERALDLDYEAVKVNAVVIRGYNDDELPRLVALARERPVEVRFIEFMPFGSNEWRREHLLTAAEIRERIEREELLEPVDKGDFPGPAEIFRGADWAGRVGFITPISDRFCARCNRIRLTADGKIKACLFGLGDVDLLGPLRAGADDGELVAILRRAVHGKEERHPLHPAMRKDGLVLHALDMNQIGG